MIASILGIQSGASKLKCALVLGQEEHAQDDALLDPTHNELFLNENVLLPFGHCLLSKELQLGPMCLPCRPSIDVAREVSQVRSESQSKMSLPIKSGVHPDFRVYQKLFLDLPLLLLVTLPYDTLYDVG